MHPQLRLITAQNRAIVDRARALNERANEPLFLQYTQEGLAEFFEARLKEQGATSFATLTKPDALRLPPLDSAKVAEILRRFPDTIALLGVEHAVEYEQGVARVELASTLVSTHKWLALPNEIRLPGGTLVTFVIRLSLSRTNEGTDLADLKREYAAELRERAWQHTFYSRPKIQVPSLHEIARAPNILKLEYGRSPIDGRPYAAYGALKKLGNTLVGEWYHDFAEAEREHDEACAFITHRNAQLLADRSGDEHRPTAARLKKELKRVKNERHHLRDTALASLWDELTSLVELRLEELPGNDIPGFIQRIQTMQTRLEEALKPPPPSAASLADLAARFGKQKSGAATRR